MMELRDGQWIIYCDSCDEELETEKDDKDEAEQVAINWNWKMEGRHHYCETCVEEEENDEG